MGNDYSQKSNAFYLTQLVQYEREFLAAPRLLNVEDMKFPLSTERAMIVDAGGRRVKLCCVNWSGAHMCRHCVDGLECRKLSDLCSEIRKFGFNCIRLTYSLQMYFDNPVIPDKYLTANPELKGKRAMDIFDIVINEVTKAGIMVVLNNHTSSSMWCCSTSDGEGLWYTSKYSESMWLECLRHFAERYRNNKRVMGVDLRNEIRSTPNLDPTWGDGNIKTDWRRAAVLGANEVLSANPDLLVMIGGLNFQLDLTGVKFAHITAAELKVPNKLVYTGHFYGFSWPIITWRLWSYENFKQKLFQDQTFVRALGVPYFIGEFGTNVPDIPWQYLIRFLKESDIDWSYWPLDGFKCDPEKDETYGIYTNNFREVRHPWLLRDLQSLQKPIEPAYRGSTYEQATESLSNKLLDEKKGQGKPFFQSSENYPPPLVPTVNQVTGGTAVVSTTMQQAPTVYTAPNSASLEKVGQMPPPPPALLSTGRSNSGSEKVINVQAVAEIQAAFNNGIMNYINKALATTPSHQPVTQPPQQQPPSVHQQYTPQQPPYHNYPHQPFQPYPGSAHKDN